MSALLVRYCLVLTLLLACNYNDLVVLAQWTKLWQQVGSSTNEPTGQYGNIMVLVNESIYIFGGVDAKNNSLDATWMYPLGGSDTASWTKIGNESSLKPPSRTGACACIRYQQDHVTGESYAEIYVFGGLGRNETHRTLYNDMWRLTIPSNSSGSEPFWSQIFPSNTNTVSPIARYEASLVLYGNELYLYGGFQGEQQLTDLLAYDLTTNQWKSLDSTITGKSPRLGSGHSAALIEVEQVGTQMVIFDSVHFWFYSFERNEWQMASLEQMGFDPNGSRDAVQIVANKDKVYFFGGSYQVKVSESNKIPSYYITTYSNTMVSTTFSSIEKGFLLQSENDENEADPSPRADVTMVFWKDKLVLFGGRIEETAIAIGQMWQFNLSNAEWLNPIFHTDSFRLTIILSCSVYLLIGLLIWICFDMALKECPMLCLFYPITFLFSLVLICIACVSGHVANSRSVVVCNQEEIGKEDKQSK